MGRIAGTWVGWMLGDNSLTDFTVRQFRAFGRRMYASYMGNLADTNKFDQELYNAVVTMQNRLVVTGQLKPGQFIRGVLDLPTEYACGFKKRPDAPRALIFTVEGHLSDMFRGPCADNARTLEEQGVCHWKPIWYDCAALPFNNTSGERELVNQIGRQQIEGPPGVLWDFHAGIHWGIEGFSQGAQIVSNFMEKYVLPANGVLHWRLVDFKRGLALGNPRREYGKICAWADNPPPSDTGGIMDKEFVTTGTAIENRWAENANIDDMFAQNTRDRVGLDKTAIAKIVTENSWIGGQASLFARVIALFGNLPAEGFAAIKASFDAIVFAARNPNPHYTTYAEPGDIEWMRGVR